jgi:hypothetical protein
MHGVAPYPLYWPLQYPRCAVRRNALFKVEFAAARTSLFHELEKLHARDVLLSSNVPIRSDGLPRVPDREPEDPGVAVYFTRRVDGREKPFALACDAFSKVRWNLRAVQQTIEALRTIERCGTTSMMEQAFSGFAQLPPAADGQRPWREVLGISPGPVLPERLKKRYLELAQQYHTGAGGGDHGKMVELNLAHERAKQELGFT